MEVTAQFTFRHANQEYHIYLHRDRTCEWTLPNSLKPRITRLEKTIVNMEKLGERLKNPLIPDSEIDQIIDQVEENKAATEAFLAENSVKVNITDEEYITLLEGAIAYNQMPLDAYRILKRQFEENFL